MQKSSGTDYIGEPISQLDHALQCAYLATQAGADDELILAALFHDIGHLCASPHEGRMGEYGVDSHEAVGADYLRRLGFSDRIARLVLGHVQAKRYLVAAHPGYLDKLSPASLKTLEYQGGPMSPAEVRSFEADPDRKNILMIRAWDDLAKVSGREVPDLDSYRGLILSNLMSTARS